MLEKQFSDLMGDKDQGFKSILDGHNSEIRSYQEKLNLAETQIIEYNFLVRNLRKENGKWLHRTSSKETELGGWKKELHEVKGQMEDLLAISRNFLFSKIRDG